MVHRVSSIGKSLFKAYIAILISVFSEEVHIRSTMLNGALYPGKDGLGDWIGI